MASENHKEMLERIYQTLPRIYRVLDMEQQYQLKRFLEVITAGALYPAYEETKNLMDLSDFDRIPKEFLPGLAGLLGFNFPYDLDEQTQRTYIKTAVAAYKRKGTLSALIFMIRELTRFKTIVTTAPETRQIDVKLEVDPDRQDFERVVDKVKFIVDEYAPPYNVLNIINTFVWLEERYPFEFSEALEMMTISAPDTDLAYEMKTGEWFGANVGLTNTTPVMSGELYTTSRITEDFTEIITMV